MTQDKPNGKCPDGQADFDGSCLPQVDFITFLYSMASATLVHLGEMPEPESGQSGLNLPLAKHSIDTLAMLAAKTKGNLTDEEDKRMCEILSHLRMLYVKKAG